MVRYYRYVAGPGAEPIPIDRLDTGVLSDLLRDGFEIVDYDIGNETLEGIREQILIELRAREMGLV